MQLQEVTRVSPGNTLRDELEAVRKGRGVQEPQLRSRMGPHLRQLCKTGSDTPHGSARRALADCLLRAAGNLPGELQLAAHAMFAVDERYSHRFLRQRYEALAAVWNCDFRTVQRRCDEALTLIVEQLQESQIPVVGEPEQSDAFDADPWYVARLSTILLLNRARPEVFEERTVVATTDGLSQLGIAFGVPRHPEEQRPRQGLDIEILCGARLDSVERPGDNMFVWALTLPRPLAYGERHTYLQTMRISPGQLMVPRYVHIPMRRCDQFELRVKFRPDALPRVVWVVSRLPELVLANQQPGKERIEPDSLGEVHVRFRDLQLGFGYGIAWLPAGGDHE